MKTLSSLALLASLVLSCAPAGPSTTSPPAEEPQASSTATAASEVTAEPTAAASAAPTAAPPKEPEKPAIKTFDFTDIGVALKVDLPPDVSLDRGTGKNPEVKVKPSQAEKWKTGISVMKADAKHSTAAHWKAMLASPKWKGKVLKEEGDLLVTLIPENQHGFVYFVRVGKETFLCQNYGATESEAELEAAIAACKTARQP